MHPDQNSPQLPKGSLVGILFIWALTILLVQFVIWMTLKTLDVEASWKECGLISALWVFVAIWFSALRSQKK